MDDRKFRTRLFDQMKRKRLSVAEVARRAGVKYDVVRDLKRREGSSTSAENARALAFAVGLSLDSLEDAPVEDELEELRRLYRRISAEDRRHLLALVRSMATEDEASRS